MTNAARAWYNYGEIISHLYREARYASGKTVCSRIKSHESVLGSHELMIHDYGPGRRIASVHVEVCADMPLSVAHGIADRIEREFLDMGLILTVHIDPIEADDSTCL